MYKIRPKRGRMHQFYSPILPQIAMFRFKLYDHEQRCITSKEGDMHLFFSDGPLEEHAELVEVEDVAEGLE